ncbi:hypothetical protein COO60DRAFT_1559186 [Scenedesmus sp. NREL 46B-D3]|nr:hypothetical protein COO60DRAFT_1559186 [Scenedesmus sp. NREL 46B-D3]
MQVVSLRASAVLAMPASVLRLDTAVCCDRTNTETFSALLTRAALHGASQREWAPAEGATLQRTLMYVLPSTINSRLERGSVYIQAANSKQRVLGHSLGTPLGFQLAGVAI